MSSAFFKGCKGSGPLTGDISGYLKSCRLKEMSVWVSGAKVMIKTESVHAVFQTRSDCLQGPLGKQKWISCLWNAKLIKHRIREPKRRHINLSVCFAFKPIKHRENTEQQQTYSHWQHLSVLTHLLSPVVSVQIQLNRPSLSFSWVHFEFFWSQYDFILSNMPTELVPSLRNNFVYYLHCFTTNFQIYCYFILS